LLKKILLGMERDLVQDMSCKTHPNSEHAVPQTMSSLAANLPLLLTNKNGGYVLVPKQRQQTTTSN